MLEDINRRRYPRREFAGEVFIEQVSQLNGESEILQCTGLDASQTGLRVETGVALPVGAFLRIGVEAPGEPETLYLVGEVRWCDNADDGHCLSGFRLVDDGGSDFQKWKATVHLMERESAAASGD